MSSKNAKDIGKNILYTPSNTYDDRSITESVKFDEFLSHSRSPLTVILLLASDENEIVLEALSHLDKFAMKSPENLQKLNQLKLIDNIMKNRLTDHTNILIQRFALKLIAEIFEEKSFTHEFKCTRLMLNTARAFYLENKDSFIVEFSALILLALLANPKVNAEFQKDEEFLSKGLYNQIRKSTDPDVVHNTYQLLSKILSEPSKVETIFDVNDFPFERILADTSNQFPEIRQSAFEILIRVASFPVDQLVTQFSSRQFFEQLFKIIENPEYEDAHCLALKLLKGIVRYAPVAKEVFTQYLDRLNIFWRNSYCTEEVVQVYNEISKHEESWEQLYSTGVVAELADRIQNIVHVSYDLSKFLSNIANHSKSFAIIMQPIMVTQLINIICSDHINWETKAAALDTLNILCKKNFEACELTANQNISTVISTILNKQYDDLPLEVFTNSLNLLISLGKDEDVQVNVVTVDLVKALINATKNLSRSVVLVAHLFNTLSIINKNSTLRKYLTSGHDFWNVVLNFLKSPSVMLRNTVAEFLMHTGKSEIFAELYADTGILEFLLDDAASMITCSNWSAAIDNILSADLSLKFNIRGRLDFTDITKENFFISKHQYKDVASFRSIIKDEVSPRYTVILVNFEHHTCFEEDIVQVPKVRSNGIILRSQVDCTYCRRPHDPFLPRYLEKARKAFESEGLCNDCDTSTVGCINIARISDRAKILAIIVDEVFRSTKNEQNYACNEEVVKQHLNELKFDLNCNIIPLGIIRYGGHFERALLFKTLADRTGLPSSLQRGNDGKTLWNELPILNVQNLRPTHIIDLIGDPGEMYPIGSRRAHEYITLCHL